MKTILALVTNTLANIPIVIAQGIAVIIGLLSYIGSLFLAIGVETHKFLRTNTGLKLIEVDKTVKKVTEYIDKVSKTVPKKDNVAVSKPNSESLRLFNIVKNDDKKGDNDSN